MIKLAFFKQFSEKGIRHGKRDNRIFNLYENLGFHCFLQVLRDDRSDLGLQSQRSADHDLRSVRRNVFTALLEILDSQHIHTNKGFSPAQAREQNTDM